MAALSKVDPRTSVSYLLAIQGIDEISLEDTNLPFAPQANYFVQYQLTFRDSTLKSHLGYFGRTLKTAPQPLEMSLKKQSG
jgi:hypothetical protein